MADSFLCLLRLYLFEKGFCFVRAPPHGFRPTKISEGGVYRVGGFLPPLLGSRIVRWRSLVTSTFYWPYGSIRPGPAPPLQAIQSGTASCLNFEAALLAQDWDSSWSRTWWRRSDNEGNHRLKSREIIKKSSVATQQLRHEVARDKPTHINHPELILEISTMARRNKLTGNLVFHYLIRFRALKWMITYLTDPAYEGLSRA